MNFTRMSHAQAYGADMHLELMWEATSYTLLCEHFHVYWEVSKRTFPYPERGLEYIQMLHAPICGAVSLLHLESDGSLSASAASAQQAGRRSALLSSMLEGGISHDSLPELLARRQQPADIVAYCPPLLDAALDPGAQFVSRCSVWSSLDAPVRRCWHRWMANTRPELARGLLDRVCIDADLSCATAVDAARAAVQKFALMNTTEISERYDKYGTLVDFVRDRDLSSNFTSRPGMMVRRFFEVWSIAGIVRPGDITDQNFVPPFAQLLSGLTCSELGLISSLALCVVEMDSERPCGYDAIIEDRLFTNQSTNRSGLIAGMTNALPYRAKNTISILGRHVPTVAEIAAADAAAPLEGMLGEGRFAGFYAGVPVAHPDRSLKSQLQRHVTHFDRNSDGFVSWRELWAITVQLGETAESILATSGYPSALRALRSSHIFPARRPQTTSPA